MMLPRRSTRISEKKKIALDSPDYLHQHTYMEECHPNQSRTLAGIKAMEDMVLDDVMHRSNWKVFVWFSDATQQFYEKSDVTGRVIALKIVDNVHHEREQILWAFRNGINVQGMHIRRRWCMPETISYLDQLQTMDLYRCTGKLPQSMNYLTKLTRLRLHHCHYIDLTNLGLYILCSDVDAYVYLPNA